MHKKGEIGKTILALFVCMDGMMFFKKTRHRATDDYDLRASREAAEKRELALFKAVPSAIWLDPNLWGDAKPDTHKEDMKAEKALPTPPTTMPCGCPYTTPIRNHHIRFGKELHTVNQCTVCDAWWEHPSNSWDHRLLAQGERVHRILDFGRPRDKPVRM